LKKSTCIAIFGPQGSGKGTQCTNIVDKYGFPYFEMGAALRELKDSDPEIAEIMAAGKLVPDPTVEALIASFVDINSEDIFILDGFPRNKQQASFLNIVLSNLQITTLIINLKSYNDQVLIQRMLERGRADDTLEVIQKRLETYTKETIPAMEFFGNLTKSTIFQLNAGQDVDDVFAQIDEIIVENVILH
jgi:adenylate kinase